jgi:predicted transposase YdaD
MMTTYDQLIEKGLQKGKIEGKQEGIRVAQREIILKGYDKGLSISFLVSLSGLPKEEVNEILQEHHKK